MTCASIDARQIPWQTQQNSFESFVLCSHNSLTGRKLPGRDRLSHFLRKVVKQRLERQRNRNVLIDVNRSIDGSVDQRSQMFVAIVSL